MTGYHKDTRVDCCGWWVRGALLNPPALVGGPIPVQFVESEERRPKVQARAQRSKPRRAGKAANTSGSSVT
jgi:hypothetical protein